MSRCGRACESIGTTGEDNPSGTPQTCAVDEPAGTVAIATGATFASARDCGENRKPGTATTCGDCLDTHAPDESGVCQERLTCDDENKIQTNLYTCGGCKNGFHDPTMTGTCVVQRITPAEVAEDCQHEEVGTYFYGITGGGAEINSGTDIVSVNGAPTSVVNPVNYCWRPNGDPAGTCYSVRPGFSIPPGAVLRDGDGDDIDLSAVCDTVHPACDSAAGHEERIAGNELSGCVCTNGLTFPDCDE